MLDLRVWAREVQLVEWFELTFRNIEPEGVDPMRARCALHKKGRGGYLEKKGLSPIGK